MSNLKYDWEQIIRDSAEVMALSIAKGNDIPKQLSDLFEKLKDKYKSERKAIPPFNTYRQVIRKKLNIPKRKKIIRQELCRFAGKYNIMSLQLLSENITVYTNIISDQAAWLFIRLKETNISVEDRNSHFYYLAQELKKKFSSEILFVSFDIDTLVVLCNNRSSRKKIVLYFEKLKTNITIISQ